MESTTERLAIEREIVIAARPETVWQFLVDAEKARRWWSTTAEIDARPGGVYRVEVSANRVVLGTFVELEPPRRLVYTFGWEAGSVLGPGASTVEIELVPQDGGTLLRLTHRGLPDSDTAAAHGRGWEHYLERLAIAAPGGDPGRDAWLDLQM